MTTTFFIILPLIILVGLGQVASKSGQLADVDWIGIEKLSFKIMLPALLVQAIIGSDLSVQRSGLFVLAIIIAFSISGLMTLSLRWPFGASVGNPQISSMFQATTRWNGLITLTIANQIYPENGLQTVTIAMAFLIPYINVGNIAVLSVLNASRFSIGPILKNITTNPLIMACAVGLALNIAQIQLPVFIEQTLDMISRGALAVGLLCVGAGFQMRRLLQVNWQVLWSIAVKFLAGPALTYGLAVAFGLGEVETLCAVLVVATPTATNGYIVARQMGGDAELYAITMNWQLAVSVLMFPALIYLVQG